MNIWTCEDWKSYYSDKQVTSGLRLFIGKDVDTDVRYAVKQACKWIRQNFDFPVRVSVYIKNSNLVRATDGDMVYDFFCWKTDRDDYPYITIATGDYRERCEKASSRDDALAGIILALFKELSHYRQWLNGMDFNDSTVKKLQRQSRYYANILTEEYFDTVEHLYPST
jgi:hypothetical protein